MPGLRSLVARRRSSLTSPQYLGYSKTPPPNLPSTHDLAYYSQNVERRCSSLPGPSNLVNLDPNEDAKDSNSTNLRTFRGGVFADVGDGLVPGDSPCTSDTCEAQKKCVCLTKAVSDSTIRPLNSFGVTCASDNLDGNSSSSSRLNLNNANTEIESCLAKRGVTVVRRMVGTDNLPIGINSKVDSLSFKDSVITANSFLAKEASKCDQDGSSFVAHVRSSNMTTASLIPNPSAHQQKIDVAVTKDDVQTTKTVYNSGLVNQDLSFQNMPLHSSQSQDVQVSVSSVAPSFSASKGGSSDNSFQSYNSQSSCIETSIQSNPENVKGCMRASESIAYHKARDALSASSTQQRECSKSTSGIDTSLGISSSLRSSILPLRSIAKNLPKSTSTCHQPKVGIGHITQCAEASPLSKSVDMSPQPRSVEMSPYSRSGEASPASRLAQVSPQSRSSQLSPLSRSVKVSPHSQSKSVDMSPQMSPSRRSDDMSPQSRYIGMSPKSSIGSPQTMPSERILSTASAASGLGNQTSSISHSSSHTVGSSQALIAERHCVSSALPPNHTAPQQQSIRVNSSQQQNSRSIVSDAHAGTSFSSIPTSDFFGRSGRDTSNSVFPPCNSSSDALLSQQNVSGFSTQPSTAGFGMQLTSGPYLHQNINNGLPFTPQSSGYLQEASAISHFPNVNLHVGTVSNTNSMNFSNMSPGCSGFNLHDISGLYGTHSNPYNLPGSASNLRSQNPAGTVNFTVPRNGNFMHATLRDFPPHGSNSTSHLANPLRLHDIQMHTQRDIPSNADHGRALDIPFQNCQSSLNAHSGTESSTNSSSSSTAGHELSAHQNYIEQKQHLVSAYRSTSTSSVLQKASMSSLPVMRNPDNPSLQQNFSDHALQPNHITDNFRLSQHSDIRSPSSSLSYRNLSAFSPEASYQPLDTREGGNTQNDYRDQPVISAYAEHSPESNYVPGSEIPLPSNFRESASQSNNRSQTASNYQSALNHASPSDNRSLVSSYQETSSINSSSQTQSDFARTPFHQTSPEQHLTIPYGDTGGHLSLASPSDQSLSYGNSVESDCTRVVNTRGALPGYGEIRDHTTFSKQCLPQFGGIVKLRNPKEQVASSYHTTSLHTSQVHQPCSNLSENVSQSDTSYQGNLSLSSPLQKQQQQQHQAFPALHTEQNLEFRNTCQVIPKENMPYCAKSLSHASSQRPHSSFTGHENHVGAKDEGFMGFREAGGEIMNTVGNTLDQFSSPKEFVSRYTNNYPNYDSMINQACSNSANRSNAHRDMQDTINFNANSQHRSPPSTTADSQTVDDDNPAALPSFTESFDQASRNKASLGRSTQFADKGDEEMPFDSSDGQLPSVSSTCSDTCNQYLEDAEQEKVYCGDVSDNSASYDEANAITSKGGMLNANSNSSQVFTASEDTINNKTVSECYDSDKANSGTKDPFLFECLDGEESSGVTYTNKLPSRETAHTLKASMSMLNKSSTATESAEKLSGGECSESSCTDTSPSSQERIVIKMKLLHAQPEDSDDCGRNYSGDKDRRFDKGSHNRYPLVKYTRWTIDSIINGREVGSIVKMEQENVKKDNVDEYSNSATISKATDSNKKHCKQGYKRSISEIQNSSRLNKFDTNKNVMKKSLKMTITNPLRARFSPLKSGDGKLKQYSLRESKEVVTKEVPICVYDHIDSPSAEENEKPERITSSLRRVRLEQHKNRSRYPSRKLCNESGASSEADPCPSHTPDQNGRHSSMTSKNTDSLSGIKTDQSDISIAKLKKCSIVIKRIYTEDSRCSFSRSVCKKKKKFGESINDYVSKFEKGKINATEKDDDKYSKGITRPKRKAAIEANEKRNRALKTFDQSLNLSQLLTAEKVPYRGTGNKYKLAMPSIPVIDLTLDDEDKTNDLKTLSEHNLTDDKTSDRVTELCMYSSDKVLLSRNSQLSSASTDIDINKGNAITAVENSKLKVHEDISRQNDNGQPVKDFSSDSPSHIVKRPTQLLSASEESEVTKVGANSHIEEQSSKIVSSSAKLQIKPDIQSVDVNLDIDTHSMKSELDILNGKLLSEDAFCEDQKPTKTEFSSSEVKSEKVKVESDVCLSKSCLKSDSSPKCSLTASTNDKPAKCKRKDFLSCVSPRPSRQVSVSEIPSTSLKVDSSPSICSRSSLQRSICQSSLGNSRQKLAQESSPKKLKQKKTSVSSSKNSMQKTVSHLPSKNLKHKKFSESHSKNSKQRVPLKSPSSYSRQKNISVSPSKNSQKKSCGQFSCNTSKQKPVFQSPRFSAKQRTLSQLSSASKQKAGSFSKGPRKKPAPVSPPKSCRKMVSTFPAKTSKKKMMANSSSKKAKPQTPLKTCAKKNKGNASTSCENLKYKKTATQDMSACSVGCSVILCDIFMNRRINRMKCPGCARQYSSLDSIQVNLKLSTISFLCCRCKWLVVKNAQPKEVEAMVPR